MIRSLLVRRSASSFALFAAFGASACSSTPAATPDVASDSGAGGDTTDSTTPDAEAAVPDAVTSDASPTETPTPEAAPADTASVEVADTSTPDVVLSDPGAPSSVFPAFPIAAPQLASGGGPVLSNPVVVTVTWPGDLQADALEGFGDQLGASAYWSAITSEYKVGPVVSGAPNHLRLVTSFAGTTYSDTEVDAFVATNASNWKTSGWPQPTSQTLYVLYLPNSVVFTLGGSEICTQGVGGYHTETQLTDGTWVAYAIIPRCNFGNPHPLDTITLTASHEIAEAATDAQPNNAPAYHGFGVADVAWTAFQALAQEDGDDCEYYRDSFYRDKAFGYAVQRQWSNASIAAGHAPCVPAAAAPYFNVTPLNLTLNDVSISWPTGDAAVGAARSINIKVGATGVLEVGYYSDGPVAAWHVAAVEGNTFPGTGGNVGFPSGAAFAEGNLTISVDHPDGKNGNKSAVTITVKAVNKLLHANLMTLVSSDSSGSVTHYFPVLITSN